MLSELYTVVSIHGGGYVCGSKELYRRYGMDMARRGFAFVNVNVFHLNILLPEVTACNDDTAACFRRHL